MRKIYVAIKKECIQADLYEGYVSKVGYPSLWRDKCVSYDLFTCEIGEDAYKTIPLEGSCLYAKAVSKCHVYKKTDDGVKRFVCVWDKLYINGDEISIRHKSLETCERVGFGYGSVKAITIEHAQSVPFEESYIPSNEARYRSYWAKGWKGASRVLSQWNAHPWETDAECKRYEDKIHARTLKAQLCGLLCGTLKKSAEVVSKKAAYVSATSKTEAGKVYAKELELSARRLERKSITQLFAEKKALDEARVKSTYYASQTPAQPQTGQKTHKDSAKGHVWSKMAKDVFVH